MPLHTKSSRCQRPAAFPAVLAVLLPLLGLLPGGGVAPSARGAGLGLDLRAPAMARARARELAQAAFTAHEQGDSARALALLDQAEALYPNQADSYNLRGAVYLRRGDYPRAASAFSRAAALDPDLWAAKFNLADIPFKQRDYPRARVLFDRLVDATDRYKATSRWELAQYKAGLCCLLTNDPTGANRRLGQLVAAAGATPSASSLHAQAALAFARRDAATGNRLLQTAQTSCKPAANALYLPSLAAAGWVTPAAVPSSGLPGTGAVAAVNGRTGNSRLIYLPGNLPITEPELPGGVVSGAPGGNPLLGNVRPAPTPKPLVLPKALPMTEPGVILPEAPVPVRAAPVPTAPGSPTPGESAGAEPAPGPTAVPSPPSSPTPSPGPDAAVPRS